MNTYGSVKNFLPLKGLSHGIKKTGQKFSELDQSKRRGWFLNFLGALMNL
jgi:hypothetical protein